MNRVRLRSLFFVSAAFILLLGASSTWIGCQGKPEKALLGETCTTSEECEGGLECRSKKCRTPIVNTKPTAVLRIDPETGAKVGDKILAIGENSRDKESDLLTYKWSLDKPSKSKIELQDGRSKRSYFIPDVAGDYTIGLMVNDGKSDSKLISITIKVEDAINTSPIANAGADQDVLPGSTVKLDGTKSTDPEGDKLGYVWTIKSKPSGSKATLDKPEFNKPSFTADAPGDYIVSLVVTDERNAKSQVDTVSIHAIPGLDKTPKLTKIDPTEAIAQSTLTITVDGESFVDGAVLLIGSKSFPATFKSDKQLTAKVNLNSLTPGKNEVKVANPNRKESNAMEFLVKPIPVPELVKLAPIAGPVGAQLTLVVTGKNFIQKSEIYFGTTPLATTYVSKTEITAVLNLKDAIEKKYKVSVKNPGGIGAKTDLDFTVTPPGLPPILKVLNPPQSVTGKMIPFSVHGKGFGIGAVIYFDGKKIPTKRIRRDELQADPTLDLSKTPTGTYDVWVQNIDGQKSGKEKFFVDGVNPTPKLYRVLPFIIYIGEKTVLSVFGQSFSPKAKFYINKIEIPIEPKRRGTSFFEANFDDTARKWAKSGNFMAYVENPGGKKSKEFQVTITHATPSIDSITPGGWNIGCDLEVSIAGKNFLSGSVVNFGATQFTQTATDPKLKLTRIGRTELKFKVLKANLSLTTYKVNVTNGPNAKSADISFPIKNSKGIPTISSIRPSVGAADSIVSVVFRYKYPNRFLPGAYVELNGKRMPSVCSLSLAGTYCYDITAKIDLSGIKPGTIQLYVVNPCGSKSAAESFIVLDPATPYIKSIAPAYGTVGLKSTLTISGIDLAKNHTLHIGGKVVASVWKDKNTITTQVPYDFTGVTAGSSLDLYILHGNGNKTSVVKYSVLAPNHPLTITKLSSDKFDIGKKHSNVGVLGTGFTAKSELYIDGKKVSASYASTTQLTIPTLDLTATKGGALILQVKDSGKDSNFFPLYAAPPPALVIDYLSPSSRVKGSTTSTYLYIYGTMCPKTPTGRCPTNPTVKVIGPDKKDYSSSHSTRYSYNRYVYGSFDPHKLPVGNYLFTVKFPGGTPSNPGIYGNKAPPPPMITKSTSPYRGLTQTVQLTGSGFVTGDNLVIDDKAFLLRKFPGTASSSSAIDFNLDLKHGYGGALSIHVERCGDATCSTIIKSNTWKMIVQELPNCANAGNCGNPPLTGVEGCTTYNKIQTCRPKCTKDAECKAMFNAPATAACVGGFCK